VGPRKPDIVGYRHGKIQNEYHIAVVGEVKGRREKGKNEEFTKAEIAELVAFMHATLIVQPLRRCVTGFLTDGKLIQFYKLHRGDTDLHLPPPRHDLDLTRTNVLSLATDGADRLLELLYAIPSQLDLTPDVITVRGDHASSPENADIERHLGSGSSAVAYAARFRGKTAVVKVFHSREGLEAEKNALWKLAKVPAVSRVILADLKESVLVLEPVGHRFAATLHELQRAPRPRPQTIKQGDRPFAPMADDFCQLVDILQACHAVGLVHRDLNLTNFFLDATTGKVRRPCPLRSIPFLAPFRS
jgi:hypothetical protein